MSTARKEQVEQLYRLRLRFPGEDWTNGLYMKEPPHLAHLSEEEKSNHLAAMVREALGPHKEYELSIEAVTAMEVGLN
jgi:hypothetical protein